MEVINPFWTFYNLFDRMKINDEQSSYIMSRLEALQEVVSFVQEKEPEQLSDDMIKALGKLNQVSISATTKLEKFSNLHVMAHMMKSSDYNQEFEKLNKSLTDAFVTLSGALHINQEKKLDIQQLQLAEQEVRLSEQEERLVVQEKKLHEQENKLEEQENILQQVESKLYNESKAYVCVLL